MMLALMVYRQDIPSPFEPQKPQRVARQHGRVWPDRFPGRRRRRMAVDAKGNVYTAEVDTGKRIQKFTFNPRGATIKRIAGRREPG